MQLIIGPKSYSTWSLRPWLVLKRCGAEFTERVVNLYGPASAAELAEVSPSRKVPVLNVDDETIWDSLAISVWCAEQYPDAGLWPAEAHARWMARSMTCEMHSAFMALRNECGMGPDHPMVGPPLATPLRPSAELSGDIRRLVTMWRQARDRFGAGGPYLFGQWSIPDAFFTPVAARVRHYGLDLAAHGDDGTARAYCDALLAQPDFLEWEKAGLAELA